MSTIKTAKWCVWLFDSRHKSNC